MGHENDTGLAKGLVDVRDGRDRGRHRESTRRESPMQRTIPQTATVAPG